jgi:hypothetical protein
MDQVQVLCTNTKWPGSVTPVLLQGYIEYAASSLEDGWSSWREHAEEWMCEWDLLSNVKHHRGGAAKNEGKDDEEGDEGHAKDDKEGDEEPLSSKVEWGKLSSFVSA